MCGCRWLARSVSHIPHTTPLHAPNPPAQPTGFVDRQQEELWTLLNFVAPDTFPDKAGFEAQYGDIKDQEQLQNLQQVRAAGTAWVLCV